MKKLIAAVTGAALAFMAFSPQAKVLADSAEDQTPSGIYYSEIGASINNYIAEREAGLASCEVCVFDGDGEIYTGYYGFSNIEDGVLADDETVYEWASTSKILVWISVMQQVERGNIDLDADIREYLPDGFLTKLQYPDEKITMVNLMCHNAGFQESMYENQEAEPGDVYGSLEEAVRACECYQSFHVGEYTAYSNWSTALAAYIVECVSGTDYVTYVHENIFEPLGMDHTSIDPTQADNAWVAAKRQELMCYERYGDPAYNQDYGVCMYAVQLFPAGAAIGTLEDLSKLGQALVSEDCPLFEDDATRDLMFSATSCFGDTDIAKNCHGLWAQQRKVMTLGHNGNSAGCTTSLEFDPVSGLGIAIMTNESGETAFTNGIPVMLYGAYTDKEGFEGGAANAVDISGTYYCTRSFCMGSGAATQYMAQVFPLAANDDGSYSVQIAGFSFADGMEFINVGENQYIMKNNGMEQFVYIEDGRFEMGYMDYLKSSTGIAPTLSCYGFIVLGLGCALSLFIGLIASVVRKIRGKGEVRTFEDKQITLQQLIYAVSGIVFALFTMIIGITNPALLTVSAILAGVLALASLVNGILLVSGTIMKDASVKKKIWQFTWSAMSIGYMAFIVAMQVFCFWKV